MYYLGTFLSFNTLVVGNQFYDLLTIALGTISITSKFNIKLLEIQITG